MRYFTYELISAANGWGGKSIAARRKAEARFETALANYHQHLESLQSRVSRDAYEFFRYGYGSEGLHDARLLALRAGDGKNFSVVIEFLNYEQTAHYFFDLRKVSRLTCDLFIDDEERYAKNVGDLYTYELIDVGDELEFGMLFASSATITAQFSKLVFRKKRLKLQ